MTKHDSFDRFFGSKLYEQFNSQTTNAIWRSITNSKLVDIELYTKTMYYIYWEIENG